MKFELKILVSVAVLAIAGAAYFLLRHPVLLDEGASAPNAKNVPSGEAALNGAVEAVSDESSKPEARSEMDIETASRFDVLLASVLAAAEAGDAEAMTSVAKVLDYCLSYSVSPGKFRNQAEFVARGVPANAAEVMNIADKQRRRCELVNDGRPISMEKVREWYSRAAAAGSIRALVASAMYSPGSTTPSEQSKLIEAALASGNPQVAFEAASLVPGSE